MNDEGQRALTLHALCSSTLALDVTQGLLIVLVIPGTQRTQGN